ncbi:MAG: DUF952 domain-containing protein [Aggregatilineales bacterium]
MILHITTPDAWANAQVEGVYRSASLATEGFIHCSTPRQMAATANKHYARRSGLALLYIDESRLTAELRYEDLNAGDLFPHIYGPINLDAVLKVAAYEPGADGLFAPPAL